MSRSQNTAAGLIIGIFSLALGALIAFLFFSGVIPVTAAMVWSVFGLGAAALFFLPYAILFGRRSGCYCRFGPFLSVAAAGAFLSALAALTGPLTPGIPAAILVFFLAAFFFALLLSLVAFVLCLIDEQCGHRRGISR